MNAPQIRINVIDQAVFSPVQTTLALGMVGPATKGVVNQLQTFTGEGQFVDTHGIPTSKHYGPRAAIRAFSTVSNLSYVRVAGANLNTAVLVLQSDQSQDILTLSASSPGTWANDGLLEVSVTYNNGGQSYNIFVYFKGQQVEQFLALDNGIVETQINNGSNRIRASLAAGVGTTFPASTVDPTTGRINKLSFAGGNDGAFAETDSQSSSTSGVSGIRFHGTISAAPATRTFVDFATVQPVQIGQSQIRGSIGEAVVPGTCLIRIPSSAAGGFTVIGDTGDLSYGPGGAGLTLLENAAGDTGYIDYRTGDFAVNLSTDTVAAGSMSANFTIAVSEAVGNTVVGQDTYAGSLSRRETGPSFYNANRVMFTVPMSHLIGTPPVGDDVASSDANMMSLPGWIQPGSVQLIASDVLGGPVPVRLYDDGLGSFRTGPNGTGDAVVSTINYRTGAWAITDWPGAAFTSSSRLSATYDALIFGMGGGAVPGQQSSYVDGEAIQPSAASGVTIASTDAGALPIRTPVSPGNVRVDISSVNGNPISVYDDGVGGWLSAPRGTPDAVAVTGTIDYSNGAWTITDPAGNGDTVDATAVVRAYYTQSPFRQSRRALRGMGQPVLGSGGNLLNGAGGQSGLRTDIAPAEANGYNGAAFIDHEAGTYAFQLGLLSGASLDKTLDVADNGTIQAVAVPANILGFGDGTETVFAGQLGSAPYRRQADIMRAFQAGSVASDASGDSQVSESALGATSETDFWNLNAVVPPVITNYARANTGEVSIPWTSAPSLDEAVFVVTEDVVLHFRSIEPGDIGNERDSITDGLYVEVDVVDNLYRARVMFDSVAIETFSLAPDLSDLIRKINDDENGSRYVEAVSTPASTELKPNVSTAQRCGMSGAFTSADIIGTKVGSVSTGLQMFRNEEDVDVDFIAVPGQYHRQVIIALQTLCELPRRRAIGIVPAPDLADIFEYRDFFNGNYNAATIGGVARPTALVPFPLLVELNSPLLVTVAPWVQRFDQYANESSFEPPEGEYAELLGALVFPWLPAAGLNRGRVNAEDVRFTTDLEDRNLVQGQVGSKYEVVNPIVRRRGLGLILSGQQTTLRSNSARSRVNVTWTINKIQKQIALSAEQLLFELNNASSWRAIEAQLDAIIGPIVAQGGLRDGKALVNATTVTAEDIDNLRVPVKVFLKPTLSIETIEYDLIITPQGASFASVIAAG